MRIPHGLRAASGAGVAVAGWDLDNAAYSGTDFSVSSQAGAPLGLSAGDGGTKLYVSDNINDAVYQYNLSTAWDIGTASYASKSLAVGGNVPNGSFFKPDGTKFYVSIDVSTTSNIIKEYTLSTAWDISTGSLNATSSNFNSTDANLRGLYIRDNGTDLYWIGFDNNNVYQFSMSTAWDITTLSYVQSFSVASQDTAANGLFFKPDGTRMFIIGNLGDKVYQYELSTAWDVTTASFSKDFSVTTENTAPITAVFDPSGTTMILIGSSPDSLHSYTL